MASVVSGAAVVSVAGFLEQPVTIAAATSPHIHTFKIFFIIQSFFLLKLYIIFVLLPVSYTILDTVKKALSGN
ncbi:hypothetical protein LAD12857_05800 [Lacrimispora amygdalina]|uniref:Uncharacterized protein n=1 Tax=Lacrimispora amygdalina TaxID=253257 RepID=A0ABQ5M1A6_9FIRM